MLAVACSHHVATAVGPQRADAIAGRLPRHSWQRISAGQGSKGLRYHDWAWITIDPGTTPAGQRSLLIRRNNSTGELACFRCYAAAPVSLAALVRVAGSRWTVEESFQASKGLAGLDQHQVRRWNSWHRWTTLAMLAYAFLAVLTAAERARQPPPDGMIPLTCNEIHHLLNVLVTRPARGIRHRLHWSAWRRRHQHRARTSHYQKRART